MAYLLLTYTNFRMTKRPENINPTNPLSTKKNSDDLFKDSEDIFLISNATNDIKAGLSL